MTAGTPTTENDGNVAGESRRQSLRPAIRGVSRWAILAVGFTFAALVAVTIWVWRQQVERQRQLLTFHTHDASVQAARRLQVFMESHLRIATIFARRWSTHETQDFSQRRFEDFASVLLDELPGIAAIGLVDPGHREEWVVPADAGRLLPVVGAEILNQAGADQRVVVSESVAAPGETAAFFAALPLLRGDQLLGYLLTRFDSTALINDCFHTLIRSEFNFVFRDGDDILYRFAPDGEDWLDGEARIREKINFDVRNRTWTLTMVPRRRFLASAGWTANLAVPSLGFSLSLALSLLLYLLLRRMEMLRVARDRALFEVEERRRAEAALKASETRYRNVFASATDGMLVLEPEGTIIEANPAAGAIHGLEAHAMVGRRVQDFIAPKRRQQFEEFREALATRGTVRLDSIARGANGNEIDIEVRGTQLVQDGMPRLLAVLTDVSERVRSLERHAQLSRKVLVAQEEERARLSRELHDELGQLLTALRLEIGWLQKALGNISDDQRAAFGDTIRLVEKATDELRRICRGLRPPLLDDLGLEPALRQLVAEYEERTGVRTDIAIRLPDGEDSIPTEIALATYRIFQEAINNVSRHAQTGDLSAVLVRTIDELRLAVEDHGVGFDPEVLAPQHSCGLAGMRERANLVRGSLEVNSSVGRGTRVYFRAPLSPARGEES